MLHATVVLRSYNRLTACCEALEQCLRQDYPSFEVLVLEQSTRATEDEQARLEALAADHRVRIERRPPLGGPGSRNEACQVARGDVIIMVDDDDMPAHQGWLSAFMKNFEDPKCLAVTGRHIVEGGKQPPYANMGKAERQVLSYSWLMWQRCYTRIETRSESIENVHGTNTAIRRAVFERFGMWDTCTRIEDESSFCYRVLRGKDPDEYMVFDPEASIVRRLDIEGGLDKRQMTAAGYGQRIFQFFHNIVAHYHPGRFVLLYPAYVWLLWWVTADWVWHESGAHRGRTGYKLATIAGLGLTLPILWPYWLTRWSVDRIRSGAPPRAPKLPPRVERSKMPAGADAPPRSADQRAAAAAG
ncbi:MAG TPA: glycosyltransferase [Kofleriaceae bacterium]|nr:glycosyltransferase [Kofleriaceae bacterium]